MVSSASNRNRDLPLAQPNGSPIGVQSPSSPIVNNVSAQVLFQNPENLSGGQLRDLINNAKIENLQALKDMQIQDRDSYPVNISKNEDGQVSVSKTFAPGKANAIISPNSGKIHFADDLDDEGQQLKEYFVQRGGIKVDGMFLKIGDDVSGKKLREFALNFAIFNLATQILKLRPPEQKKLTTFQNVSVSERHSVKLQSQDNRKDNTADKISDSLLIKSMIHSREGIAEEMEREEERTVELRNTKKMQRHEFRKIEIEKHEIRREERNHSILHDSIQHEVSNKVHNISENHSSNNSESLLAIGNAINQDLVED